MFSLKIPSCIESDTYFIFSLSFYFFRKKAGSSSAVEARAKAAEARMKESKKIKEKLQQKEDHNKWKEVIDLCDESDEDDDDHGRHNSNRIKEEESDEDDSDAEVVEQILDQEDLDLGVKSENEDGAYWEDEHDAYLKDDLVEAKGGESFTVATRTKDRSSFSSSNAEASSSKSKGQ